MQPRLGRGLAGEEDLREETGDPISAARKVRAMDSITSKPARASRSGRGQKDNRVRLHLPLPA
jgi:hypothetical protein